MQLLYEDKNISFWDELAQIHSDDSDYNLNEFNLDTYQLKDIEINLLGDITGKRVLHLQCHIGLDSLALEKRGAKVTAIDYSATAIETANQLKLKFNLSTEFHCASVYDLANLDLGLFDIVFTSYGILVWLENLDLWAKTISSHLNIDGRFLIIDEHPIARMFGNPSKDNTAFNNGYLHKYWNDGKPFFANYRYSYASDTEELKNQEQHIWSHSVSEIINALVGSDLSITSFDEYNKTFYQAFSQLTQDDEGWWTFADGSFSVPLIFSLQAIKKGIS